MSTLDNLISTIRTANILPTAQVNFGITDNLQPPYLAVTDYSHTYEYQTGGVASSIKTALVKIVIVDKSQTDAETLASALDTLLNCTKNATPTCIGCLQTSYKVGQLQMQPFYQFGVEVEYEIYEGN